MIVSEDLETLVCNIMLLTCSVHMEMKDQYGDSALALRSGCSVLARLTPDSQLHEILKASRTGHINSAPSEGRVTARDLRDGVTLT